MKVVEKKWPQFLTITNLEWKPLLAEDKYRDIVIDSLRFLNEQRRVRIYAFVIMINHLHLIWKVCGDNRVPDVQRDFLKYTAQKIKADLRRTNPAFLEQFKVKARDRHYQFWERNSLGIGLWTDSVFMQKLNYIHRNPVKAGLCKNIEDYKYSSALFYKTGVDNWGFLTHYRDWRS